MISLGTNRDNMNSGSHLSELGASVTGGLNPSLTLRALFKIFLPKLFILLSTLATMAAEPPPVKFADVEIDPSFQRYLRANPC
jgi:hypothetical protein